MLAHLLLLHEKLISRQVGQGTADLGDITIDTLFDLLGPACHESGQCETNTLSANGQWIGEGVNADMGPITVTLTPSGDFPTWIHNGLLDILKASVIQVADCRDVVNVQTDKPGGTRTKAHQCLVPSFWGVNYQAADNAAPPFIGVSVSAKEDDRDSPCQTALETLGGLAGQFNATPKNIEVNTETMDRCCLWSRGRGLLPSLAYLLSLVKRDSNIVTVLRNPWLRRVWWYL